VVQYSSVQKFKVHIMKLQRALTQKVAEARRLEEGLRNQRMELGRLQSQLREKELSSHTIESDGDARKQEIARLHAECRAKELQIDGLQRRLYDANRRLDFYDPRPNRVKNSEFSIEDMSAAPETLATSKPRSPSSAIGRSALRELSLLRARGQPADPELKTLVSGVEEAYRSFQPTSSS
jgi:chromosome segregation ATPase